MFARYRLGEDTGLSKNRARLYAVVGEPPLLYKCFVEAQSEVHADRVRELVEVGRRISSGEILGAARRIVWPLDLVVERGQLAGVLIPRAGAEYFRPGPQLLAQGFSHLAHSSSAPAARSRLILVRQLANAFNVLSKMGYVHGDLSGGNVLWTLAPELSLLVVDCDGLHPRGFPTEALCTDGWKDPRLDADAIRRHDVQSDWYALALAVYRVLVLNPIAVPGAGDYDRITAQLPGALAELIVRVFSNPLDAEARVAPERWRDALRGVIADRAQCERIDALTRERPSNVGDRRRARAAAKVKVRSPRDPGPPPQQPPREHLQQPPREPVQPSPPRRPNSSLPSGPGPALTGGPRVGVSHRSRGASRGRRLLRRLALVAVLAAVGIFGVYHFTGLPNWPILNELNPFLSSSQRDLVASLPVGVHHCVGEGSAPPRGALAMVTCEWNEREVVAIRFASVHGLDAFYEKRLHIARAKMAERAWPARCPASDRWHLAGDRRSLGALIAFVSQTGARLDWSQIATRIYFMGFSASRDLTALCGWWTGLGFA